MLVNRITLFDWEIILIEELDNLYLTSTSGDNNG